MGFPFGKIWSGVVKAVDVAAGLGVPIAVQADRVIELIDNPDDNIEDVRSEVEKLKSSNVRGNRMNLVTITALAAGFIAGQLGVEVPIIADLLNAIFALITALLAEPVVVDTLARLA
jgi:hypothetical protein